MKNIGIVPSYSNNFFMYEQLQMYQKMDAPEIWEKFSDAPSSTGSFTEEVMIFAYEISAGPVNECDRLKPSAMG